MGRFVTAILLSCFAVSASALPLPLHKKVDADSAADADCGL